MKYFMQYVLTLILMASATFLSAQSLDSQKNYKAVFFHGSDWCVIGERIKKNVWDNPEFQNLAQNNYLFYSVDELEYFLPKLSRSMEVMIQKKSPEMFKTSSLTQTPGGNIKRDIASKRATAYVIEKTKEGKADYTFRFSLQNGVNAPVLAVEFADDPEIYKTGIGANGNRLSMTHLKLATKQAELPVLGVWASHENNKEEILNALRTPVDAKTFWGVNNTKRKTVHFAIATSALKANTEYELTLSFQSSNAQQTPSRMAFVLYESKNAVERLTEALTYRRYREAMSPFIACQPEITPGVSVFAPDNTFCGSIINLEYLSLEEVNATIQKQISVHKAVVKALKEADGLSGIKKATRIGEAFCMLEPYFTDAQIRKQYESSWKQLLAADPQNKTGYTQRFDFAIDRIAKACEKEDPVAYWTRLLHSSANLNLRKEQRQLLYIYFFRHYKEAKQESVGYKLLKEGYAIAPESHYGHGIIGYLCNAGEGPVAIPYGWNPKDVKAQFTWDISIGVPMIFDHEGFYEISFEYTKGTEPLQLQRIAYGENGNELVSENLKITLDKQSSRATCQIQVKSVDPKSKQFLRISGTSTEKGSSGKITAKPILPL